METTEQSLAQRLAVVGLLLLALSFTSFLAMASQQSGADTTQKLIRQEVERYKATPLPEERAAVLMRLEILGETDSEALNQLGLLYLQGAPENVKLAEQMFNKAASAKSLNGLMNLIGVQANAGRLIEACSTAAVGSAWPNGEGAPAKTYLGQCFQHGRNGPKDAAKAESLFMEACQWSWLPACDSAMISLRKNPTLARKKAYRSFLEKLSGAAYPPAMYLLASELANSTAEPDQIRSVDLFEKASAAKYGPACTALALVLWGKGDVQVANRIDELLDCGIADKRAPELAWLFKGIFAALQGEDDAARTLIERSYAEGLKQAGAFSAALGYPVPLSVDPTYCEYFCDYVEVLKEAQRLKQLQISEQNRQGEIERSAMEIAAREAAQQAAQEAAEQAAYTAQVAAQNAEVRRERRRRFWSGVLTVAVALATGYVQAQADAYASPQRPPRPVYQPPAISAPYRPIYQPPAVSAPSGMVKVCYVVTPQGSQAVTVNSSQVCPVSLHSMGQPLRFSGTGYLVGESISGLTKICLYNSAAGQSSMNISSSGVCPPSHQF